MPVAKLAHYSIRTTDLEASRSFYVDVLGLREGYRPAFDFPGIWLYLGVDESDFGVVHLIGIDARRPDALAAYLGERPAISQGGSGDLDHIAFLATDWAVTRARLDVAGLDYSTRVAPSVGLLQVFVVDPCGITIELNYPAAEADG